MEILLIEAIGLCEHCGVLLNAMGMPAEAMDAKWNCPNCKKELTHESFGFEKTEEGKFKKIRWVGKEGKWVTVKPTENFEMSRYSILVHHLPMAW